MASRPISLSRCNSAALNTAAAARSVHGVPKSPNSGEDVRLVPPPLFNRADIHAHISDEIYRTVVRIVVHCAEYDYDMPFKIKGNREATGTGFFIDTQGHLLTCAHVVQDASHVFIEIPSEGKTQYKAQVLGVCPKTGFDVAVLRVDGYVNRHFCEISQEDAVTTVRPGDETFALGFPLGQDNLKVTRGIISGQQDNMYQIDTPINPGNSGGPLIKHNKVIGINGAGMLLANNIGYAIPIARYFLLGKLLYAPRRLIRFPEVFGFEYQPMSEEFVKYLGYRCADASEKTQKARSIARSSSTTDPRFPRSHAPARSRTHSRTHSRPRTRTHSRPRPRSRTTRRKAGDVSLSTLRGTAVSVSRVPPVRSVPSVVCSGGIYIKRTYPHSPASSLRVTQGDILCSINGVSIDQYGEFEKRWMNQKMNISNMLTSLPLNSSVAFTYWSAKNRKLVHRRTILKEHDLPIRIRYPQFEDVAYEIIGGMVVVPLCIQHCVSPFIEDRIKKYAIISNRNAPRLYLSAVLIGSTLGIRRTVTSRSVVVEVNDRAVATVEDFRRAVTHPLRKQGEAYLKIKTEDRNVAVLNVRTVLREEPHLQKVYKYPPSALLPKLGALVR